MKKEDEQTWMGKQLKEMGIKGGNRSEKKSKQGIQRKVKSQLYIIKRNFLAI